MAVTPQQPVRPQPALASAAVMGPAPWVSLPDPSPAPEDLAEVAHLSEAAIKGVLQGLRGMVAATRLQIAQDLAAVEAQLQNLHAPPSEDTYRLHAVFVHEGAPTVGHYKAYVQGAKPWASEPGQSPGRWFCFNDSIVNAVSLEEVQASGFGSAAPGSTRNAYLLMYVKDTPWQGALNDRAHALRAQVAADDEEEDNREVQQLAADLEGSASRGTTLLDKFNSAVERSDSRWSTDVSVADDHQAATKLMNVLPTHTPDEVASIKLPH